MIVRHKLTKSEVFVVATHGRYYVGVLEGPPMNGDQLLVFFKEDYVPVAEEDTA
jgi:hypothetical protein